MTRREPSKDRWDANHARVLAQKEDERVDVGARGGSATGCHLGRDARTCKRTCAEPDEPQRSVRTPEEVRLRKAPEAHRPARLPVLDVMDAKEGLHHDLADGGRARELDALASLALKVDEGLEIRDGVAVEGDPRRLSLRVGVDDRRDVIAGHEPMGTSETFEPFAAFVSVRA